MASKGQKFRKYTDDERNVLNLWIIIPPAEK